MKTVSVCCDSCGAALDFPQGVKFVTCNYCKSKLKVKVTDSTAYTEVIEEVRAMSEDVKIIKYQNELERLDREWESQKALFMISRKNGASYLPTDVNSMSSFIPVLFGGLIGIAALSTAYFGGSRVNGITIFMFILSILTVLFGIGLLQNRYKMTKLFLRAEAKYKKSRRELLEQMHAE